MAKKILSFFSIVAYGIGTIGGFGYSAWGGSWFIAICILALAAMAFPYVKKCFKDLTE